jgi:spore coat polysaccharide biosynthesis protein SpsF
MSSIGSAVLRTKRNPMNTVAIIQARMASARLPGKVLLDIAGKTMLEWVTTRVRRASFITQVVVATTTGPKDDLIVRECQRLDIACYRGSELDVLDRYYRAATEHRADAVIRVTSECPLIDPGEIERVVQSFRDASPSYASNSIVPGYLRGLDTEVMTMESLARAWREARHDYHRAHVTPYIYQNPHLFRLLATPISTDRDLSRYRWTIDTQEDLEMVRSLCAELSGDSFGWQEALAAIDKVPELASINGHVRQKLLEQG